ncbi:hypothetical protein HME9302_02573 [Alteripontixanthobacter maritimus]|uniref:Uncharacterized protein n=1 Tax=Alteripontixanthobacter maritimus TaxID=2161824 RepID=A0A369Q8Z3_9SPHN|nr:hypothetical protein [Alteripontixanthobacter maritimus]RDC61351.1 hypothetical protein HME9302_02573 [Alteripontixanthobacter maritimus]
MSGPDIEQDEKSPANAVRAELEKLSTLHVAAVREHRRIDAALLEADYGEKFAAWCEIEKANVCNLIAAVTEECERLDRRRDWWRQLSSFSQDASGSFPVDGKAFENCEHGPRDWDHARKAMSLLPEFTVPDIGNIDSWQASYFEIDGAKRLLLQYLHAALAQFDITDPSDPSWVVYRDTGHGALQQTFAFYEDAWAKAEFTR